jgi:hypothetical protein
MITQSKVIPEQSVGIAAERVCGKNDNVSFKESVSLVARQEKLKGSIFEDHGVARNEFAGVSKLRIIWPSEFT